ncbi:MAG: ferredoxin [Thermotogae bacterium]|nr:MAG: ferredoxin [Thermotogota bacterium]
MSEIPRYLREGYLSVEELKKYVGLPSEERLRRRPVAVPECPQEIPCTPCAEICPTNAVLMKHPNAIPKVDYEKCTGCSLCVQICPGLAFFMVHYVGDKARITLPHEILPVPKVGEEVILLNRIGKEVGKGRVVTLVPREKSRGDTPIITVEVPIELAWEVRAVKVVRR